MNSKSYKSPFTSIICVIQHEFMVNHQLVLDVCPIHSKIAEFNAINIIIFIVLIYYEKM